MNGPITIVAGGWSASQFDLRKLPGTLIGVNDAAVLMPRVDLIVSMDRLWAEHRFEQLRRLGKPTWLRRKTLMNIDTRNCPWLTPFDNDHTSTVLSEEPGRLNGTHSGFCALNLAYQLRPTALYLVGFDMARGPRGEAHWFPPYSWSLQSTGSGRLALWARQFEGAAGRFSAEGIRVFLASSLSTAHGSPLPFARINRTDLEAACAD